MIDKHRKEEFLLAYEKYADAIYRHCLFRVYSKARAEELSQETFTKTWQYLAGGKKVENMRAFLYRIATNLIIDESRKKKEESLDALLDKSDAFEPSVDSHKDMERSVVFKEVLAQMRHLKDEERTILIMRYLDDLDPKEIAEVLNISPNNASVKLNRAVRALRRYVA